MAEVTGEPVASGEFVIDYRVGGTEYHAPQEIGLQLCVERPCPG